MKKLFSVLIAMMLVAMPVLTGCSGDEGMESTGGSVVSDHVSGSAKSSVANKMTKAAMNLDYSRISAKADVDIELSDAFVQLIEESGADLYGVKKVSADLTAGWNDNLASVDVNATVNDVDIVSGNAVLDMTGGELYLTVPELSDTSIRVGGLDAVPEETLDLIYKAQDGLMDLVNLIIDSDVPSIAADYVDTAVSKVGAPEDTYTDEIFAGYSSKVVDASYYVITGDEVYDMADSVLKKAKTDKRIKNIIVKGFDKIMNLAVMMGEVSEEEAKEMNGALVYSDAFLPAIDELISELEYSNGDAFSENEELFEVVIFEDNGKFAGFELETADKSSEVYGFHLYIVSDGDKLAWDFGTNNGTSFIAEGTVKDGLFNGNFKMNTYGSPVFDFKVKDVDCELIAAGVFEGTVIIDDDSFGTYVPEELEGFKLELTVDNDVLKTDLSAKVYYDDELMVTLTAGVEISDNGQTPSIPDNFIDAEDNDASDRWLSTVSLSKVIGKLEEAGISTAVIAMLQDAM